MQRGVSSGKEDVHQAIRHVDKGLFPNAFCKVIPDMLTGDPDYCLVMHADGAGTKSSLAYLYWKETGDLSVWKGIAQDAIVMNLDDLLCVGVTGDILLSSTIGRNKNKIPGGGDFCNYQRNRRDPGASCEHWVFPSTAPEVKLPMWVTWSEPSLWIQRLLPRSEAIRDH